MLVHKKKKHKYTLCHTCLVVISDDACDDLLVFAADAHSFLHRLQLQNMIDTLESEVWGLLVGILIKSLSSSSLALSLLYTLSLRLNPLLMNYIMPASLSVRSDNTIPL